MAQTEPTGLSAEAFLAWSREQPEGRRYELAGGRVVAMAPERAAHALTKQGAARALEQAVSSAGLACEVFPDGMAVKIDEATVYEPDALLRCGGPIDRDAVVVADPLLVVEVLSPASKGIDSGRKLTDYFRLESLRHYLVIDPERRVVVHHALGSAGAIATAIRSDGRLRLDPPGLDPAVGEIFARL